MSFAQHVNALPEHSRKAIRKYLPTEIEGLSSSKQRKILGQAIAENNLEAVKVLLECGVDVNRYDWRGVTPVFEACKHAHVEIVEVLLNKGADPNILAEQGNQWAPLHMCVGNDREHIKPRQNCLACAEHLLNHGADVNRKTHLYEATPLHFVNPNKQPEFVALLLSRGANPIAERANGERPKLRPQHFRGLEPHLTAALQQGKQDRVDRWIEAVEKHLPDPQAASVLAEWAPLCVLDGDLSKRIHTAIEHYWQQLEGDPPLEVLRYVAGHNAREIREEVLLELSELEFGGIRDFKIKNMETYSVADHGVSLVELASTRAQDPDEDHMQYVMAILKFVAATAKDAPNAVRTKLHDAVVALLAELSKSAVPELVERASNVRDFIGKAPFALDTLEPVQKQQ